MTAAGAELRDEVVDRIGLEAVALSPVDRDAHLDRRCGEDGRLRTAVVARIDRLERQAGEITELLWGARRGDRAAFERLWEVIYDDLRRMARRRLARERRGDRLPPTELVQMTFLRLRGGQGDTWESRRHFFGAAARAMQRILIERARPRASDRAASRRVPLEGVGVLDLDRQDAEAVRDALLKLETAHPRAAEVVYLRLYAGLSVPHVARALGFCERTVKSDWAFALPWLYRELTPEAHRAGSDEGRSDGR